MWLQSDRCPPASSLKHLPIDSLQFALALRSSGKPARENHQETTNHNNNVTLPVTIANENGSEEPTPTSNHRNRPCKAKQCQLVEVEILQNRSEKLSTINKDKRINRDLQEDEELLLSLTKEYDVLISTQQRYMRKLTNMEIDMERCNHSLNVLRTARRNMEGEVVRLKRTLEKLQNKSLDGKSVEHKPQSSIRKHNGVFNAVQTGTQLWSCCLATKMDSPGCIEDHSVGVRSNLIIPNNNLHHSSSIVLPYCTFGSEHQHRPRSSGGRKISKSTSESSTPTRKPSTDMLVGIARELPGQTPIHRNRPMSSPGGFRLFNENNRGTNKPQGNR